VALGGGSLRQNGDDHEAANAGAVAIDLLGSEPFERERGLSVIAACG